MSVEPHDERIIAGQNQPLGNALGLAARLRRDHHGAPTCAAMRAQDGDYDGASGAGDVVGILRGHPALSGAGGHPNQRGTRSQ